MTAAALLGALTLQGVALENNADRLKVRAPRALKPRVLDAIRSQKLELLELLTRETASRATSSTRGVTQHSEEFADARAFRRALKQARRDIDPVLRRDLTESELNEYSFVVACLACGIDPRGVP